MRIASALVFLLLAAGCQRAGAPQSPPTTNLPANAAATALPEPSTVVAPKAATKTRKKNPAGVLATVTGKNPRPATERQGNNVNNDPCAGLDDAALDDCLARDDDAAPANDRYDRAEPSLDRPELTARDRELMQADEAAARDRDRSDPQYDGSDYGPQDDPSELDAPPDPDEELSPEDLPPPDDYPPDEFPPDNGR